jgi:NAD(P)-dependent dehydrogenase (short-subunit alcohol dehydrogenase family)
MWSRSVERGTVPRARPPMHSAGSTKGVVAIVGCGLGLGGAIAVKFASEGYTIAAMARSQESLDAVKDSLAKVGSAKHGFYSLDATKKAEVDATFEKIVSDLGAVSVLVYNVSDSPKGLRTTVLEIAPEDFLASFNLNCLGALLCTQAVLPRMIAAEGTVSNAKGVAKKGTILYTSATSAFRSTAKSAQVACGKAALRMLSQAVAKEHGKQGVHAVHIRMDCTFESPRNEKLFTAGGMGEM